MGEWEGEDTKLERSQSDDGSDCASEGKGEFEDFGKFVENSPIEEVALTVPITDDPSMPVWTFRMWTLGVVWCAVLAFVNQFFFFRTAPLSISALTAQIASLYMGRFMERMIPKKWHVFGYPLNPGPFNMKEHVLITIFANVGAGIPYAVDIVTLVKNPAFYGSIGGSLPFFACLIFVNTTQVIGYGFAGLFTKYLVEPAHMWWPGNLVAVSLFRALHERDEPAPNQMSRFKMFYISAIAMFFYYMLPGFFMPILTSVAVVCLIWPNSVVAAQIGSGMQGMGIGSFSFDWATIAAFNGNPMATPWFAIVNIMAGFGFTMWVLCPALYWGNLWYARNFEYFGTELYYQNGTSYDILAIVDPATLTLNEEAYAANGPIYLSTYFAVTYAVSFASLTASLTHVGLWHGREIFQRTISATNESDRDIHSRLMDVYPKNPDWWFYLLLVGSIVLSIIAVVVWPQLQLPWWGIILSVLLAGFFTLPLSVICATTNQLPGLNVITELLMGLILPGQPVANIMFKTFGYIGMAQAVTFLSDFKLGHYMKIPPRAMFLVQVIGTVICSTVALSTAWWQLETIPDICNKQTLPADSPWRCPISHVFFDASIIWGLIGPKRIFGAGSTYAMTNLGWLIGFLLPFPTWILYQFYPSITWLPLVNFAVFLSASGIAPPASTINFTAWFVVGFIFQYYLFNYHKGWWSRYNYVLSAGLEIGVAFSGIFIFFVFQSTGVEVSGWVATPECPLASCPTMYDASVNVGAPCPVWGIAQS